MPLRSRPNSANVLDEVAGGAEMNSWSPARAVQTICPVASANSPAKPCAALRMGAGEAGDFFSSLLVHAPPGDRTNPLT